MSDSLWPHGLLPANSSVHGISQASVGCHFLLQGIFPIHGLNPSLLLGRLILYPKPPGKPPGEYKYIFLFKNICHCFSEGLAKQTRPTTLQKVVKNIWVNAIKTMYFLQQSFNAEEIKMRYLHKQLFLYHPRVLLKAVYRVKWDNS